MTPSDWYRDRTGFWAARRDGAERQAILVSRLRLAAFLGSVAAAWWGFANSHAFAVAAAVAGFAVFGVLVVRHARILHAIDCAEGGARLAAAGLAREARDWSRLADVPPPAWLDVEAHPYARDLDLLGHASLATWIGRAATLDGADRLWRWLLDPADAAVVWERQPAIEELAARREGASRSRSKAS